MEQQVRPLRWGQNPAHWLNQAAEHGIPALLPITLNGKPSLASGAWIYTDPSLHETLKVADHGLRVLLALETCRRVYAYAERRGATHHIR